MKRSTAVAKIKSLLDSLDDKNVKMTNKLKAEIILVGVEELGMLPPTTLKEHSTQHGFLSSIENQKVNKWDDV